MLLSNRSLKKLRRISYTVLSEKDAILYSVNIQEGGYLRSRCGLGMSKFSRGDAIYIVRDSRPKSSGEEYSSESQIEDEISIKFRIFDARRGGIFRRGKGQIGLSTRGRSHPQTNRFVQLQIRDPRNIGILTAAYAIPC